jgi:Cell division protein FtsI/penicillin-binding protein 2
MAKKATGNKIRRRILSVLMGFLVVGFGVLIVRLFSLQIVHGEEYQSLALQQQTRSTTLGAQRGIIYDRNENVLAKSADVWNVCISPADIPAEKIDKLAGDLAEILGVEKEAIVQAASNRTLYYQRIKNRVESPVRDEVLAYIEREKATGIFFEGDSKRYYRYGSLASTLLGFTDYDGNGAYGLEAYYNSQLAGTPGMVVSTKNALGADMTFKYSQMYDAQDGNSLVLTIDESIQHFLERNLETAVIEHQIGNRACGIVMNIKTGEILAMATKPDFNPNEPYIIQSPTTQAKLDALNPNSEEYAALRKELWYEQWRNKAISDTYEPGSVFKILNAATAVDNNLVSLAEGFFCPGYIDVSGERIRCWDTDGHGAVNFVEGIQKSCNPVFITLGQRIGAQTMYSYMENFGLGEKTGVDLPGEVNSIRQSLATLSNPGMVELSSTSMGQSFKVTPLQMITAASAAVNGGNLMQPYIVKQVLAPDGSVISTTLPTVRRQVISAQSSQTMRYLLEAVVDGGSGRYAAVPGYRIGGKTGTSQKLDKDPNLHILSFIGFAPMDDPEYAILLMLDEPKIANAYGSVIAAPVVGAIFQEMLPYLGYEPTFTQAELAQREITLPDLVGLKPHDAQAELTTRGLKTRIVGTGPTVIRQIPQAWQKVPNGGTVTLYVSEEVIDTEVEVPDVVGMSALEANLALTNAGLNIEIRGVTTDGVATTVGEQWPLAGTNASTGEVVIITLVRRPEETAEVLVIPELLQQDEAGA